MKQITRFLILSAAALFTLSCSKSPSDAVKGFLDAAIARRDIQPFLASGTDASAITKRDATSYEIKNIAGDVVSVVVHFKGTQTHTKPGYTIPYASESIDMPEAMRFRVTNGKITEVF